MLDLLGCCLFIFHCCVCLLTVCLPLAEAVRKLEAVLDLGLGRLAFCTKGDTVSGRFHLKWTGADLIRVLKRMD